MLNDNHLGALIHFRGAVIQELVNSDYTISIIASTKKSNKEIPFKK